MEMNPTNPIVRQPQPETQDESNSDSGSEAHEITSEFRLYKTFTTFQLKTNIHQFYLAYAYALVGKILAGRLINNQLFLEHFERLNPKAPHPGNALTWNEMKIYLENKNERTRTIIVAAVLASVLQAYHYDLKKIKTLEEIEEINTVLQSIHWPTVLFHVEMIQDLNAFNENNSLAKPLFERLSGKVLLAGYNTKRGNENNLDTWEVVSIRFLNKEDIARQEIENRNPQHWWQRALIPTTQRSPLSIAIEWLGAVLVCAGLLGFAYAVMMWWPLSFMIACAVAVTVGGLLFDAGFAGIIDDIYGYFKSNTCPKSIRKTAEKLYTEEPSETNLLVPDSRATAAGYVPVRTSPPPQTGRDDNNLHKRQHPGDHTSRSPSPRAA